MTWSEYRRTTRADMRAKRYRTTQPLLFGSLPLPSGTEVRVEHKHDGFTVVYVCPCCTGMRRKDGIDPACVEEVR